METDLINFLGTINYNGAIKPRMLNNVEINFDTIACPDLFISDNALFFATHFLNYLNNDEKIQIEKVFANYETQKDFDEVYKLITHKDKRDKQAGQLDVAGVHGILCNVELNTIIELLAEKIVKVAGVIDPIPEQVPEDAIILSEEAVYTQELPGNIIMTTTTSGNINDNEFTIGVIGALIFIIIVLGIMAYKK